MRLDKFNNTQFDRGRHALVEACWLLIQSLFISSWIPGSRHRVLLLRLFGAQIGKQVNIKPKVKVKFPWRLEIGNYTWIGEKCWIDNLAKVRIGSHCCLSQEVYLCTGSHNWKKESFDLVVKEIEIDDSVWLASGSKVGPGVKIHHGAVLTIGSVATQDLEPHTVHQGNPAIAIKIREIISSPPPS